jgi:hypothetical protein
VPVLGTDILFFKGEINMKIFDHSVRPSVKIDMPQEMENFLNDIKQVCTKHGLCISHEDHHGSFEIEAYDDNYIEWLFNAGKSYKEPNKVYEEANSSEAIFTDNEMIKIWLADLLNRSNKCFAIYLTIDEINNEIKEVKNGISNEKIWTHTDPVHENNISTLSKYLDILHKILEERKIFEQNKLNKQSGGNEEC